MKRVKSEERYEIISTRVKIYFSKWKKKEEEKLKSGVVGELIFIGNVFLLYTISFIFL